MVIGFPIVKGASRLIFLKLRLIMIEEIVFGFVFIGVGIVCLTAFMIARGWLPNYFNDTYGNANTSVAAGSRDAQPSTAKTENKGGGGQESDQVTYLEEVRAPLFGFQDDIPDWSNQRRAIVAETIEKSKKLTLLETFELVSDARNKTAELSRESVMFKLAYVEMLAPTLWSRDNVGYEAGN